MFVLLEHRRAADLHWDLLIELAGQDRLPAWRLLQNPLDTPFPINAERIDDHRRAYLDYEGEISGGRGFVRRLDRGPAEVRAFDDARVLLVLGGEDLRGRFELLCEGNQTWRMRRVDQSEPRP